MKITIPQPNLLDRAVAWADPERGLRRMRDRTAMAVLDGAGYGHHSASGLGSSRNYRPAQRNADGDNATHLGTVRGQSRDLYRNNPIARGAIDTNVNRVVGTGLALQPEPAMGVLRWSEDRLTAWKAKCFTEFSLWADSNECDLYRQGNFYDAQALVLLTTLASGDAFTNMPDGEPTNTQPYKLRLQVLEADRIGNPANARDSASVCGGIKRDDNGVPVAAFVYDEHPGSLFMKRPYRSGLWLDFVGSSGRRRLLHHARFNRPEQSRGVPYLAPIVDLIKQLGRYTEAEIEAAVISAFFAVFITTDGGNMAPVFGAEDPKTGSGDGGDFAMNTLELQPGAILGLNAKEKPEFANPNRPNTAFAAFVEAMMTQIGMGLNLPRELLMKQFNASYSASKAALLDAWIYFRVMRVWLSRSFCQPVYETWMAEAVSTGRIVAPGFFKDPLLRWAYTRTNWYGDSMGSINPKDEVAAYLAAIEGNLMTRERAEWELFGTPWDSSWDQKVREAQQIAKAGLTPQPKPGAAAPQQPALEPQGA